MSVLEMRQRKLELDPEQAKMFYNWFHASYPDWQTNKWCTTEEVRVMRDLEEYILKHEEIVNA